MASRTQVGPHCLHNHQRPICIHVHLSSQTFQAHVVQVVHLLDARRYDQKVNLCLVQLLHVQRARKGIGMTRIRVSP